MGRKMSKQELVDELHRLQGTTAMRAELIGELILAVEESERRERELHALNKGARAVLEQKGFTEAARSIFDHCKELIGATEGYVALLSETGEENEVLFLEAGGMPCDVDPLLPMPIRGLREESYRDNKAVYHNDFMNSCWVEFMPRGHMALKNVMFAPLVLEEKTVGIIGLANKPSDFSDNDAEMATGFGKLAAIALQNSKYLDELKTLSGLLPICMHCKNIRDDKGYWNRIENYIQEHADVTFTHGVCKECLREHYPELGLHDE